MHRKRRSNRQRIISFIALLCISSLLFLSAFQVETLALGNSQGQVSIDYPGLLWGEDTELPGNPSNTISEYKKELIDWGRTYGYDFTPEMVELFMNSNYVNSPIFYDGEIYIDTTKPIWMTMRDIIFLETAKDSVNDWERNYYNKIGKEMSPLDVFLRAEKIVTEVAKYQSDQNVNPAVTVALLTYDNNIYDVKSFVSGQLTSATDDWLQNAPFEFKLDSGTIKNIGISAVLNYLSQYGTEDAKNFVELINYGLNVQSVLLGGPLAVAFGAGSVISEFTELAQTVQDNLRTGHFLAHYHYSKLYPTRFPELSEDGRITSLNLNLASFISENDKLGLALQKDLTTTTGLGLVSIDNLIEEKAKAVYCYSTEIQKIQSYDLADRKRNLVTFLNDWYESEYETAFELNRVGKTNNIFNISISQNDINNIEHGVIKDTTWTWAGDDGAIGNLEEDYEVALSNKSYITIDNNDELISFRFNMESHEDLNQDGYIRITTVYEDKFTKSADIKLIKLPHHSSVSLYSNASNIDGNEFLFFGTHLEGDSNYKKATLYQINTKTGKELAFSKDLEALNDTGTYSFAHDCYNMDYGQYIYYIEVDGVKSNELTMLLSDPNDMDDNGIGDDLPDNWETQFYEPIELYNKDSDPDNDGKPNYLELKLGTHPLKTGIEEILTTTDIYYSRDLYGHMYSHVNLMLPYSSNIFNPVSFDLKGKTVVLHGNINIEGEGYSSTLDLNGGQLVVEGDLSITNGTLKLSGGSLEVKGNFTMNSSTILVMDNESDYLKVHGDFNEQSTLINRNLTAGTLEVKGNLNIGTTLKANGSHKILLSGSETQNVYINNGGLSTKINTLEITNDSASDGVILETPICILDEFIVNGKLSSDITLVNGLTLKRDTVLDGDLYLENKLTKALVLNGYNLLVKGNLISNTGSIYLNGGELTVEGSLYQDYGRIDINKGKLIVKGNKEIERNGSVINGIKIYGNLSMIFTEDYVKSEKDFIYQRNYKDPFRGGVLEVKGDYTCISDVIMTNTHKVKLSGEGLQTVENLNFNILEITNTSQEGVEFPNQIKVSKLFDHHQNNFTVNNLSQFPDYDGDGLYDDKDMYPTIPQSEVIGDFNNDNIVSIQDLLILKEVYGTKAGDDNYLSIYDLNSDGIINIYDIVILARKI